MPVEAPRGDGDGQARGAGAGRLPQAIVFQIVLAAISPIIDLALILSFDDDLARGAGAWLGADPLQILEARTAHRRAPCRNASAAPSCAPGRCRGRRRAGWWRRSPRRARAVRADREAVRLVAQPLEIEQHRANWSAASSSRPSGRWKDLAPFAAMIGPLAMPTIGTSWTPISSIVR
jgi:hypothetical protein